MRFESVTRPHRGRRQAGDGLDGERRGRCDGVGRNRDHDRPSAEVSGSAGGVDQLGHRGPGGGAHSSRQRLGNGHRSARILASSTVTLGAILAGRGVLPHHTARPASGVLLGRRVLPGCRACPAAPPDPAAALASACRVLGWPARPTGRRGLARCRRCSTRGAPRMKQARTKQIGESLSTPCLAKASGVRVRMLVESRWRPGGHVYAAVVPGDFQKL